MEIIFQLKCADCLTEEKNVFQHMVSAPHHAHQFMKQKDVLLQRRLLNLASYDAAASALIDLPCSKAQSRLLVL